jgi:hypothetical protein
MAESAFDGSLKSGGRFGVGAFGRNLAFFAVKMFSHVIYKVILYILCFQCDLQIYCSNKLFLCSTQKKRFISR